MSSGGGTSGSDCSGSGEHYISVIIGVHYTVVSGQLVLAVMIAALDRNVY
jgi:hypothetical protein